MKVANTDNYTSFLIFFRLYRIYIKTIELNSLEENFFQS